MLENHHFMPFTRKLKIVYMKWQVFWLTPTYGLPIRLITDSGTKN
jgi:hypothetical protein